MEVNRSYISHYRALVEALYATKDDQYQTVKLIGKLEEAEHVLRNELGISEFEIQKIKGEVYARKVVRRAMTQARAIRKVA